MKKREKNVRIRERMPWDNMAIESAWKLGMVASRPASYRTMMDRCLRRDMEVMTVLGRETVVDILLPMGESLELLKQLVGQIGRTDVHYKVLFLDDCVQNEEVRAFVEEYLAEHEDAKIIRNERKIGIVPSLNRGLVISRSPQVVLLGAEVTLPEKWLERLIMPMIKDPTVASVTPFTNHGMIAGFPVPSRRNRLFDDETVEQTDDVFKLVRSLYTTIPYGVGFCMAMNRDVVHKIGILDQQNYKELDGADIDWALRAARAGYRNVMAENLYVKNDRFSTELLEGERMLSRMQEKILMREAPDYKKIVDQYEEEDPLAEIRAFAFSRIVADRSLRRRIIFHQEGSHSADTYMRRYIDDKLKENEAVMTVQYSQETGHYLSTLEYDNFRVSFSFDTLDEVMDLASRLETRRIIMGRLGGFPKIPDMLQTVRRYADKEGSRLVVMLLDYLAGCPRGVATDLVGHVCDFTNADCEKCRGKESTGNYWINNIEEWRKCWKTFLRDVYEVLYYSDSLLKMLETALGPIEKSHKMAKPSARLPEISRTLKLSEGIHVLVMGPLDRKSGLDYVKSMLREAEKTRANVHFYLWGKCEKRSLGKYMTICESTGHFDLPSFVYEHDIDVCLIPDSAPDAIGLRAMIAREMGLPAVCRNIGESAYVISRYHKGKVLSEDPAQALSEVVDQGQRYAPPVAEKKWKVLFLTDRDEDEQEVRVWEEFLWKHGIQTKCSSTDDLILRSAQNCDFVIVDHCSYSRRLKMVMEDSRKAGASVWYLLTRKHTLKEEEAKLLAGLCRGFLVEEKSQLSMLHGFVPESKVHLIRHRRPLSEVLLSKAILDEQKDRDRYHLYPDTRFTVQPEDAFCVGWMHDGEGEGSFSQTDCMKVIASLEEVMRECGSMRLLVSEKIMLKRENLQLRERMIPVSDDTNKERWMLLSQCDVVLKPIFTDVEPFSGSEEMAMMAGIPVIKGTPEELAQRLREILPGRL